MELRPGEAPAWTGQRSWSTRRPPPRGRQVDPGPVVLPTDRGGGGGCSRRCVRFLYFTWKIFTCLFTHVMLVTLVVGYCVLGALTFSSLEAENEKFVRENVTFMRGNLTEELWSYSQAQPVFHQTNWTLHVLKRLKVFENDLVLAMRKSGWDGTEGEGVQQWTLTGALFYSIIVITTIGYGHIAPKTPLGKVTTIFYAIVGIPLMLLCLSNIGDIMAHSFRFLYWRVCCYSCTKAEAQSRHNSRRRQRSALGPDWRGMPDYNYRPGVPFPEMVRGAPELDDWEMVFDEEIPGGDQVLRGPQRTRHLQQPSGNVDLVQQSVLYNKYAIEEDLVKGQPRAGKQENETELSNKQPRNIGPPNRKLLSQEHLNTSPRIMSPMGFIVPRQNQPKLKDYYEYPEDARSGTKPVPIWLCVFLVVSYIVGGAVLFSGWEQWSYADSAYFCFITLTTIGFGDFVPAQRVNDTNGQISIALCSLYLLFGIALLAMSFNLVQEEVITNVKTVARHLGIIKDEGEIDD